MELIRTTLATERRNWISRWNSLINPVDDSIMMIAATAVLLSHKLTHEQWAILSLEVKFLQHTLINELHALRPVLLIVIGTALMKEDTLDNAHLLSLLGALHETAHRSVVIVLTEVLEPVSLL